MATNYRVAFVPHLAPRSSSFCNRGSANLSMRGSRAGFSGQSRGRNPRHTAYNRSRRASVVANAEGDQGMPDFDDIAKQLSLELQNPQSGSGDAPPMPKQDANSDELPVIVTVGPNDMPKVVIRHAPTSQQVEVFFYGAALTSWTVRGTDHLWMSGTNKFQPGGKAIRGGIPICFPQFGPYGDLVQHGFARISDWRLRDSYVANDTAVSAVFGLSSESDSEEVAKWPFKFDAEYMVTLSAVGLETKLSVKNIDDKPFQFTCAFHNYFKVSSVKNARIFGFENMSFRNRLDGDKEQVGDEDSGAGFQLEQETDRIYPGAPEELAMFDFELLKVLKIKKTPSLPDATLWNPYGADGADPGWNKFICIEPACIVDPPTVQPGETWMGAQLLGVE